MSFGKMHWSPKRGCVAIKTDIHLVSIIELEINSDSPGFDTANERSCFVDAEQARQFTIITHYYMLPTGQLADGAQGWHRAPESIWNPFAGRRGTVPRWRRRHLYSRRL